MPFQLDEHQKHVSMNRHEMWENRKTNGMEVDLNMVMPVEMLLNCHLDIHLNPLEFWPQWGGKRL